MILQLVDILDGPDLEHLRQWLRAGFKQSCMFLVQRSAEACD